MIEQKLSFFDLINFGVSIAGIVFLYRDNSNFTNDLTESFDNKAAYIYGILSIFCWAMANYHLHRLKIYVHHTIDTLFVSLFNCLVIPAGLLIHFSIYPTNLTYEWP
jgi:drug/metabolite transporter (DMT)-like permease